MSYDRCVRCGSCLQFCPVFDAIGEEQFSPRGKAYYLQVMDLVEKDKDLAKEFRRLLFECTLCGRCEETCTAGINLMRIWHERRAEALSTAPDEFEYLEPLRDALSNVKNIYGLSAEDRAVYWLDELEGDIPNLQERVFRMGKASDNVIFLGCLMSFRASQIGVLRALFLTLEKLGVDYLVMGAEENCCGHPLHLMGDEAGAEQLREHNKRVIKAAKAKRVITCCPGCLIQLREHHSLGNVEALHSTEFFDRLLGYTPKYRQVEEFSYHDPCELHRILKIKTEPRSLLNKMQVKFRDMDLSCCGGGGLLRMTDPALSDKIMQLRAASEVMRDTVVITACPSCREQLLGQNLVTRDILELLSDSLRGGAR